MQVCMQVNFGGYSLTLTQFCGVRMDPAETLAPSGGHTCGRPPKAWDKQHRNLFKTSLFLTCPGECLSPWATKILYNSLRCLVLSTISFTSSTISSTSVQTRSWMLSKACSQWNMKTNQWMTLRPLRRKHLILTTFPVQILTIHHLLMQVVPPQTLLI